MYILRRQERLTSPLELRGAFAWLFWPIQRQAMNAFAAQRFAAFVGLYASVDHIFNIGKSAITLKLIRPF